MKEEAANQEWSLCLKSFVLSSSLRRPQWDVPSAAGGKTVHLRR